MKENELNSLENMMKEQLNEKEFELKEHYWANAQKLIQQERRKRKAGFIIFSLFLCLVASGLIVITFLTPHQTQLAESITNSKQLNKVKTEPNIHTVVSTKKKRPSGNKENFSETDPIQKHKIKQYSTRKLRSIQKTRISTNLAFPDNGKSTYISSPSLQAQAIRQSDKTEALPSQIPFEILRVKNTIKPFPLLLPWPDSLPVLAFTNVKPLQSDSNHQQTNLPQKRSLTFESGLTYFNPVLTATNNIAFTAGLRYAHSLKRNLSFEAGVFYCGLHQNLSDLNYEQVHFTFKKITDKTTIQTPRLDYIQIPAGISWKLFKRNSITAGVTYGILFHSSNRVKYENINNYMSLTKKETGYTFAINRQDIQLTLGYNILLTDRFNCLVKYGYGVTDISKNRVFHSNATDRNMGLGITLGYKLF